MNTRYLLALALVVGMSLAACSSETETTPAAGPASADSAPAAAVRDGARLMGGYVPTFAHRVRSQRHEPGEGGKYRHIVIVEYLGIDDAQIGDVLRRDLEDRKLTVRGPMERAGAQRYLAQNSRIGQMFADINTQPKLALGKGAQGTIYFTWQDDEKR